MPRFWCPSDASYRVDANGYLADPAVGGKHILATGQLSAYRCLVLLGEPGAGKTRTVNPMCRSRVLANLRLRTWECLVQDACSDYHLVASWWSARHSRKSCWLARAPGRSCDDGE